MNKNQKGGYKYAYLTSVTSPMSPTYAIPISDTTTSLYDLMSPSSSINFDVLSEPEPVVLSATSPMVITTESDRLKSPYLPSIKVEKDPLFSPFKKQVEISFYQNLNADPNVHKRMVNHFYYKVLDKYLYGDLIDILNYTTVKNGTVSLIPKLSDYNESTVEKESVDTIEKKIDFIAENFFSKDMMRKILNDFVIDANVNWVDLPKKSYFIKQLVKDKLLSRIRKAISHKITA